MAEKTSDLLLKGCEETKQCFERLSIYKDGYVVECCAVGAILVGLAGRKGYAVHDLPPYIAHPHTYIPLFKGRHDITVFSDELLIYMNDKRHFSREYCASVLKSLGY